MIHATHSDFKALALSTKAFAALVCHHRFQRLQLFFLPLLLLLLLELRTTANAHVDIATSTDQRKLHQPRWNVRWSRAQPLVPIGPPRPRSSLWASDHCSVVSWAFPFSIPSLHTAVRFQVDRIYIYYIYIYISVALNECGHFLRQSCAL